MDIKDLKYLALEGGGGKGAVYLGAIRAIEDQLKDLFFSDYDYKAIGLKREDFIDVTFNQKAMDDFSILDIINSNDNTTKIQGIAGSSAGAVTAFALALGLNSKQIEAILEYSFEEFLKEKSIGKYRMVGKAKNNKTKTELYVGQDKFEKLGAGNSKPFEYSFSKVKKQGGNFAKMSARNTTLTVIFDIIIDGILSKAHGLQQLFSNKKFTEWFNVNNDIRKFLEGTIIGLKVNGENESRYSKSGLSKGINKGAIRLALMQLLRLWKPLPFNIDLGVVGNVIWDRGAFSGFLVREFFFDATLLAATRDTHFQRGFLKHLEKPSKKALNKRPLTKDEINKLKEDLNSLDIKEKDWFKTDRDEITSQLQEDTLSKLEELKSLTFKEFNEITNIDIGFNVTNMTTDSPMFFSHKHTPDFPILEAVAAAMSIPPAIKPLYNEADVYKPEKDYKPNELNVYINKNATSFVNTDGDFSLNNYYLFEAAVKKYLSENNKENINIDTNNPINRSAFLEPLKEAAFSCETPSKDIKVGEQHITVSRKLLIFFYNAAYKGMFMDGGATCNIPYNYFRDDSKPKELSLEGVLALKLDNDYPAHWKLKFKPTTTAYNLEANGKEFWDQKKALFDLFKKDFVLNDEITSRQNTADKTTIRNAIKTLNKDTEFIKKTIKKLQKEFIENNNIKKVIKPWQKQKSIFGVIGTIQYGTEEGQIKYLSDHNHIVPLYCYGIGVYDFDMTKIKPLIELATTAAENQVENLFNQ